MNIAYCISGVYNSGGMERVLSNKANYLADIIGYNVSVITTDQQGRKSFFPFSNKIKFYDLAVNYTVDLNHNLLLRKISSFSKRSLHKRKLSKFLSEENFDIVISMMDDDFYFLYQMEDGSIKIAEFHFSRFSRLPQNGWKKFFSFFYKKLDAKIAKKYTRFIVLTDEDRSWWKELNNVEVIYNSLANIPEKQAQLEIKTVTSIGRLTFQKGFDRLIHAWKFVISKNPDWKLNIYGSGELDSDLKSLILALDLSDSITIFPATKNIETVYLNSSIYVLTSRFEGFGMVLLEAQSYGLPVISFACPCGPKDIIENNYNGILVRDGSILELADGINTLIADDQQRKLMGENARKSVIEKFDNNVIMDKWVSLFNELLISK